MWLLKIFIVLKSFFFQELLSIFPYRFDLGGYTNYTLCRMIGSQKFLETDLTCIKISENPQHNLDLYYLKHEPMWELRLTVAVGRSLIFSVKTFTALPRRSPSYKIKNEIIMIKLEVKHMYEYRRTGGILAEVLFIAHLAITLYTFKI